MADQGLPNWPRRMKAPLSAAYVGESETKFLAKVRVGRWPQGIRDGGNVYWYREDLDARLDQLKPAVVAKGDDDGWEDYVGQA